MCLSLTVVQQPDHFCDTYPFAWLFFLSANLAAFYDPDAQPC